MKFNNLNDWLSWQESLNPAEIDLGLDRPSKILEQAGLSSTFDCPLITVAGTNGKGSVVAMLEAFAIAADLKVCSYTSPHIFHYNERIKINGLPVADEDLCGAFERIDNARRELPLTYFEFGTLAAIDLFFRGKPDLVILEVGLGGRLDAVNIMDADISVISSVSIDHVDWLGDNRESIGYEKAGVARQGKTLICGDRNPPLSVLNVAKDVGSDFLTIGRDYDAISIAHDKAENNSWGLQSGFGDIAELPEPVLRGEFQKFNAATAIVALQALLQQNSALLAGVEPADFNHVIATGLSNINLSGRFQQLYHAPQVFADVAHNPEAAQVLAEQVQSLVTDNKNRTWAIVGMLSDKDVAGVLKQLSGVVDNWCFSGLPSISRGLSVAGLAKLGHEIIENQCTIQPHTVLLAETVAEACQLVLSKAKEDDLVVIFGSFYTVAEALQYFSTIKDDEHD